MMRANQYRKLCVGTGLFLALIFATLSCGETKPKQPAKEAIVPLVYRYFDREIYFSKGSNVSPEQTSAQDVIRAALEDLELASDLGAGYFTFAYEDDSILQPVATETQSSGRNWRSFVQTWDDNLLNDYLTISGGATPDGDQDIIVATNKTNVQQYYILTRLSCFLSGPSCGFPSLVQSKMLVWRAYGYMIGMRLGSAVSSAVMKPSIDKAQEDLQQQRNFLAEFNNRLEAIKNNPQRK